MLPIELLLSMGMLCSTDKLDQRLDAVQREARFILKTIARLRHMQNVSLLFNSPSRQMDNQLYLDDIWQISMTKCRTMFRRMLGPEQPDVIEDVEKVAAEAVNAVSDEIEHPSCLVPGPPLTRTADRRRSASAPQRPSARLAIHKNRLSHPPYVLIASPISHLTNCYASSRPVDTITVVVDAQSQSIFQVHTHLLSPTCRTQEQEILILDQVPLTCIYLPGVTVSDFTTFHYWTLTGRILQYPARGSTWYTESQAQLLISALALGIKLDNTDYQNAALSEFLSLAPQLEWPEDYVNAIFSATEKSSVLGRVHPARRMIVAIVAAKTCGKGKRAVRQGFRVMGVEGSGERVARKTFWNMYDEFCHIKGGVCGWPRCLEEVVVDSGVGGDRW
ncbi:hypothetical protein Tdes44962_MAKER00180 [Teratosphaeria destructans]|uniref:Uncharacterized protein n=1 Tax=Teratosphaeria destructans TaxID=418781 RepID=A0A9W7SVC4_9PEZI|nr:hypothetical protein Tdes44962_MAKER00180 [Teratosphaeria destructans]